MLLVVATGSGVDVPQNFPNKLPLELPSRTCSLHIQIQLSKVEQKDLVTINELRKQLRQFSHSSQNNDSRIKEII